MKQLYLYACSIGKARAGSSGQIRAVERAILVAKGLGTVVRSGSRDLDDICGNRPSEAVEKLRRSTNQAVV